MRILFLGDGSWATRSLVRLVAEDWDVAGVVLRTRVTDPDLAATAAHLGVPVFQPADINDPGFIAQIAALRPELLVSVSYDQILRKAVRTAAPLGCVNFHAGKLPAYRGRSVLNWALINGETEIGMTAHFVDAGIDTGDVILQRMMPIAWTDTYAEVLANVSGAFPELVSDALALIRSGQAGRRSQPFEGGTYFCARRPGDEWLSWSDSSHDLYNKIRGITRPGPGARTLLDGRPVTIWRAWYDPAWPAYRATPGEVVARRKDAGVVIKTGDSTLLVQEVQIGPAEPTVPDWRIGTRFGSPVENDLDQLRSAVAGLRAELAALRHPESK